MMSDQNEGETPPRKRVVAHQAGCSTMETKLTLYCDVHGYQVILGPYEPIWRQPNSQCLFSHYAYVGRGGEATHHMQYSVAKKRWQIAKRLGGYIYYPRDIPPPKADYGRNVRLAQAGLLNLKGSWFSEEELPRGWETMSLKTRTRDGEVQYYLPGDRRGRK